MTEPFTNNNQTAFRLRDWTVQPSLNRLLGANGAIQIEPRLMELLLCLAKTPGEVFSRQELLHLVWGDTTVGEEALTRAVSELRRVLGDHTREPIYIETIRKRGYRLLPTLDQVEPAQKENVESEIPIPLPKSRPGILSNRLRPLVLIALVALALVWFGINQNSVSALGHDTREPWRTAPLTSYPGAELRPALSPDGSSVAFAWDGPEQDNFDIYVKQIGQESPLRLTDQPGRDDQPIWGLDGKSLNYVHSYDEGQGVWTVPLLGGEPQEIFRVQHRIRGFTWVNQNTIVYGNMEYAFGPSHLLKYNLSTGESQLLFEGLAGTCDLHPTLGPDGVTLAFLRCAEDWRLDIYLLNMETGVSRCLVSNLDQVEGICWDNDGESVIFSSRHDGTIALRRAAIANGVISWIPLHGEKMFFPSVARDADLMAFQHSRFEKNIWQIIVGDGATIENSGQPLITSTHTDYEATFSPDSRHIAFTSDRSGNQEIWICKADGSEPMQLTKFEGSEVASPSWSPDGLQIVLSAGPKGFNNLFVVDIADRRLIPLTLGQHHDVMPTWSADGQWIYCNSNRDGVWKIWKLSADGNTTIIPVPVTDENCWRARQSFDGKYLYYSQVMQAGLWRLPLEDGLPTGPAQQVLADFPRFKDADQWDYYPGGLVLFDKNEDGSFLLRHEFATGETSKVAQVPVVTYPSVTISQDGAKLLYSCLENKVDDLVLVEGFR